MRQILHFLAAPTKQKGVAAFQTNNMFSLKCLFSEERIDFVLRGRCTALGLTDKTSFSIAARHIQYLAPNQTIVNDDISGLQSPSRTQRISLAGIGPINFA